MLGQLLKTRDVHLTKNQLFLHALFSYLFLALSNLCLGRFKYFINFFLFFRVRNDINGEVVFSVHRDPTALRSQTSPSLVSFRFIDYLLHSAVVRQVFQLVSEPRCDNVADRAADFPLTWNKLPLRSRVLQYDYSRW